MRHLQSAIQGPVGRGGAKRDSEVDMACLLQSPACCGLSEPAGRDGSPPLLPSPQRGGQEIRGPLTQCWTGSREDTEAHQGSRASRGHRVGLALPGPGGGLTPTHPHINGRALEPQSAQVQEPGEVGGAGMNEKMSSLGVYTGDQAPSAALIALHTHPVSPSHIRKQEKQTQKQLQTSLF